MTAKPPSGSTRKFWREDRDDDDTPGFAGRCRHPAEWQDRILHAYLKVGDAVLMASDAPPGMYARPQRLYVSAGLSDPAQAERIFNALANGGTVQMPFGETFWAYRFGMLVDRFGRPWVINCEQPS